jgi:predicted  nucleic acid-binding Zn-ribbon protein
MENTQKNANYCPCSNFNKKFVRQTRNDINNINYTLHETYTKHNKLVDKVMANEITVNALGVGLFCVGIAGAGLAIVSLIDGNRIDKLQRNTDILEAKNTELELELYRMKREIEKLKREREKDNITVDIK